MPVIAVGVLLVLAGFLTVSAAAKTVRPGPAAAALVELGLPVSATRVTVAAGVAVEAVVGAGVMVLPHSLIAQSACIALFASFALAGALALRSGSAIECGCLGTLHRSSLGWAQVLEFALVLPGVIFVGRFAPAWSVQTGLAMFFVVQMAACCLLLAILAPDWWRVRRDRISLARARVDERGFASPLAPAPGDVNVSTA